MKSWLFYKILEYIHQEWFIFKKRIEEKPCICGLTKGYCANCEFLIKTYGAVGGGGGHVY